MGIYLNPNNANFLEIVNSGKYIDKSMIIDVLNSKLNMADEKFVCISRPRRFGKSMAEDMISAYYSKGVDSEDLFSSLKISKTENFEKNLNKFNVIKIDLNARFSVWKTLQNNRPPFFIESLTKLICNDFKEEFPSINFENINSVADCIQTVYQKLGQTFIIIIDEYDVLLREQVAEDEFDIYLAFLNSIFKNADIKSAISLAYITGILPIIRDKIQSKLNTFEEFTVLNPGNFDEFFGFTPDEVKKICQRKDIDFDECKSWYDGYKIGRFEIYNPQAVIRAADRRLFASYWSNTSTYKVVEDKINMNFDGTKEDVIKMLSGGHVDVEVGRYCNTMKDFSSKDDVFTFLIHLGYLAYDADEKECYIPNKEVMIEWKYAVSDISDYAETNKIISSSKELLKETVAGNEERVAKALDESHIHVTSNRSYNNEDSLQSAIYLAYIYALNDYTIIKEMTTGKGFADIVYIPFKRNVPAMVVELKRNGSTESALDQIKDKKYFDSLEHYSGDLLFVGINYDEKTKIHQCKIERFVK